MGLFNRIYVIMPSFQILIDSGFKPQKNRSTDNVMTVKINKITVVCSFFLHLLTIITHTLLLFFLRIYMQFNVGSYIVVT